MLILCRMDCGLHKRSCPTCGCKVVGWQPIESAPEGTPILVYQPKRELFEGYWLDEIIAVAERSSLDGWITISHVSGYEWESELSSKYITHWMPLPASPDEETRGK